ncbi:MAG: bifunctional diaminohydroxyphosphoribosylaminopyrimidine deaminase/5-amino-6-(5-phosphoribosylamino)uracil reductase RibD [Undibacterium sp.]|uniref:bifunctional diaminohydroxyphosphoribosylaminopyrimidine deaminase/5-amino-6-(5-phosphoribosylamino)uracil reductase RibD n=1 Tax=Undibacterium sp. TaxID=1914977 RepID=UPI0027197C1D|nr:bifunctional diaminohydroxyphosphoribosylaminopyrimidine deaminase/5-amino-6-(5-phosphoribosylamino)uracil reductase RibD [Undibacterium sp.]MDO8652810.1 bifunctional diaminohydroxyphosphoribosylaminopyrimidine deaminase/5-amino-6-(5-phosphoribosylamino)uracil reductase RibD [Undibacterium sp.]
MHNMQSRQSDLSFMQMALELASRATIATSPNPKVGCVIVNNGIVIGRGWTQPVGQAHAEVQALRDAAAQGHEVSGATAYVTLEPCSHYGSTPPCANALIDAGIVRVLAAVQDANPQVSGRGLAMLSDAGIAVECGLLAEQAREMNLGFFKRMETGKPWVRMKVAASLDGRTALPNGHSQWITAPEARQDGHVWRARADAILTGIGTVLADDPQMSVRGVDVPRQPKKIVLDSHLRISPSARLLQESGATVVCACADVGKQYLLEQAGAEVLCLPDSTGKVNLTELMLELGRRQINELHVEAGAKLNGALIEQGCVDELLIYLAPKLLGNGAGLFDLPELATVDQAKKVVFHEVTQIGETLRILVRFH